MKNIRFRSLSSASYVVQASQHGRMVEFSTKAKEETSVDDPASNPDVVSPPAPKPVQVEGKEVSIKANRMTATASGSVFFEVDLKGFDEHEHPLQDCLIVWNFGDPGARFADLSGRIDMLKMMDPTQRRWNDANVGYGFLVSHVYRNSGEYSVYADVFYDLDRAPIRSNAIQVKIEDPEIVFPPSQTVYVSTGKDFSGVPSDAVKITTKDAKAAINRVSPPARVLFKRGDTFDCPVGNTPNQYPKLYIGAWGDKTKPRPLFDSTLSGFNLGDSGQDTEVIVKDIDILGPAKMNVRESDAAETCTNVSNTANGFYTYDNVRVRGGKTGIMGTKGFEQRDAAVAYLDCEVTDWVNYGIYGKWPLVAFLGTYVHGSMDAFQYNSNSGGGSAHRIEAFGIGGKGGAYFCCTDCYMNYAGRFAGHQPPYKVQGDSNLDTRWVWDRVITEGSTDTSHGVGSTIPDRQFALIDKHIHIGTANCGSPLSIQQGGTTVRNYYYILPNVPNEKLGLKDIGGNYQVSNPAAGTSENRDAWFYVYGCSALIWADVEAQAEHSGPFTTARHTDSFKDTQVGNNLVHAPFGYKAPQLAPVDTTSGTTGIARYPGRRDYRENGGALQTKYATPQVFSYSKNDLTISDQMTMAVMTPIGGVSAERAEKVPFDYIDGTLRGTNPAPGAFKPSV